MWACLPVKSGSTPPYSSHLDRNPRRVMWGGSGRLEGQRGARAPPQDRQELPPVGRGLSWTPGAGGPHGWWGGSSRGDGGGESAQVAMNAGGSLSRRQVVARAGLGSEVPVPLSPQRPPASGAPGRGLEAALALAVDIGSPGRRHPPLRRVRSPGARGPPWWVVPASSCALRASEPPCFPGN